MHAAACPMPAPSLICSSMLLQVIKMDDCIGAAVEARVASMGNGDIMLLENVRFHSGEEVRGPTQTTAPFFSTSC